MTSPSQVRPILHFTPTSGWINDPHGITARNGVYEVMYQHVPDAVSWAPHCHWGHATGPDLLSLRERPIAIAPGDGDDGIWTGCIVEHDGESRAFYTATSVPDFGIGRVRVARPDDDEWISWTKGDVVVEAPSELDLVAFRDPFIRKEGDRWRMFVGASDRQGTALALTYVSQDLEEWEYDGVALERSSAVREPVWMGSLWECPQIFESAGQGVMVSSIWEADVLHYAAYAVGSYENGRLSPDAWGRLTWGPSLYAPSLFMDADGVPALTFWLRGIEGDGWAGAHSVPYRLEVSQDRLIARPHPDVAAHRGARSEDGKIDGLAADIEWESANGALLIRSGAKQLAHFSVVNALITATVEGVETEFPVDGPLRVIVDGPVLEVSSDAGIYAVAVAPEGNSLEVEVSAGDLVVYELSKMSAG